MGPYLLVLIPGTIWVTGNALLGAVVARALFAHAPAPMAPTGPDQITRTMAGQLFGDCLEVWYGIPLTVCCLLVCIGLGWLAGRAQAARRPLTSGALILAFVVLGFLHLQAKGTVTTVGQQAEALRRATPAEAEALRPAFQASHHASESLVKLETAVVFLLVAGIAIAALRRRPVTDSPAPGPT